MSSLVRAVSEWGTAQRADVTDVAELARLEVVESLAVRWARVVVSRSSTFPERVAASRELRALLAGRRVVNVAGHVRHVGGVGDDGAGLGGGVGGELEALYGAPVAG